MAHYISQLELWSKNNSMKLNLKKTKEMIFGSVQKTPPVPLCVDGNVIDTVKCFKLLGINIQMTCAGTHMLMLYVQKWRLDYIS